MNNSVNKSRKNTFDHIPNFNNTKTTYVFINKSQKKLRTISRDRYEENYKNYLEPSINENNQNHVNQKINKKSILINKFVDNKQNMNHQYDYDYNNYNYFYDNFNYSSNLVPINYTSFYNGNYLY